MLAVQCRDTRTTRVGSSAASDVGKRQGIAQSAGDIELVTDFGDGFPRWRGGLMHYADSLGVEKIVAQLEILAQEDPVAWKVSPFLRRCADAGQSLAEARPMR